MQGCKVQMLGSPTASTLDSVSLLAGEGCDTLVDCLFALAVFVSAFDAASPTSLAHYGDLIHALSFLDK